MNRDESLAIEMAVDKAVKKVFAILGVDVNDPASVESFREDLRFGRKIRKAADRGWLTLASAAFMAVGLATWEGMKRYLFD